MSPKATVKRKRPADPHIDLDQQVEASAYIEDPLGLGYHPSDEELLADDTAPALRRELIQTPATIKAEVQEQIAEARAERMTGSSNGADAVSSALAAEATASADPSIAAVIAQLQAEITKLKSQTQNLSQRAEAEERQGEGGLPFMYYKRPKDGGPMAQWIICGSGGVGPVSGGRDVGSYSVLLGKGFKPLPRYGITGSPASHHGRPGHEYTVFLNNGGGKEVPASQVLALRWHIDCPVPGTVFPQYEAELAAGHVEHFECDEGDCYFSQWFLRDDQTTAGACMAHLRAQHGYKHDEARAVLKEMGVTYRTSRVAEAAAVGRRARREFLESPDDSDTDDD
mgnify:CR=1 FL=1